MDLLRNQDGLGVNEYISLSQYPERKEILDKLHTGDKCHSIIPIAEVAGKIKRRAAGTDILAVEAKDLPPLYFLDRKNQGKWPMKNLTTKLHKINLWNT